MRPGQHLSILADATNGTLFYDVDAKTVVTVKDFSAEARQAAGRGFARLAALKYAAAPPDVEAINVTAESRDLLETLHHGLRA